MGHVPLRDYIGNDLAEQNAKRIAEFMAYPTTLRRPADANLYLIKAYQRRMVEINIHCMRNFPHPKQPKRKPTTHKDFAERLRELILSSDHPHIVYDDTTRRWQCTHCGLNLFTHPLYEYLRRNKSCSGLLAVMSQGQRLDRPIPLFLQGPPRVPRPQAPRTVTLNGTTTDPTHRLAYYRGVYYCMRCGHLAYTEVHKLRHPCQPPKATGKSTLKRLREDKPPLYIQKKFQGWPAIEKQAVPQNIRIPILSRTQLRVQVPPPGRPRPAQHDDQLWSSALSLDDSE